VTYEPATEEHMTHRHVSTWQIRHNSGEGLKFLGVKLEVSELGRGGNLGQ